MDRPAFEQVRHFGRSRRVVVLVVNGHLTDPSLPKAYQETTRPRNTWEGSAVTPYLLASGLDIVIGDWLAKRPHH